MYFSKIPTFVLSCPGENGKLQISGDAGEDEPAVGCHVSPIHALIEMKHHALNGRHFDVQHAGWIDQKVFRTADGTGLTADLRVAWPIRNGKIVLRPDGALAVFAYRTVHRTSSSSLPSHFEIEQKALHWIDSLHERAGLFAWREAYRSVVTWSPQRRAEVVRRAMNTMSVTKGNAALCVEVALFDPEFEQWHIVPCADLP